jgi:hypothetical protein
MAAKSKLFGTNVTLWHWGDDCVAIDFVEVLADTPLLRSVWLSRCGVFLYFSLWQCEGWWYTV